jgi:hypothetical protein
MEYSNTNKNVVKENMSGIMPIIADIIDWDAKLPQYGCSIGKRLEWCGKPNYQFKFKFLLSYLMDEHEKSWFPETETDNDCNYSDDDFDYEYDNN